jgi:hypothetical protein
MGRPSLERSTIAVHAGESPLPGCLAGARARPRRATPSRVALVRLARGVAVAAAIASAAAAIAGCGSSAAPAPAALLSCLPSGLTVTGGRIEVLSVQGATCVSAEQVTASVIFGLEGARALDGAPSVVDGWNCVTYGGNQATCQHAHATLYAQYALRRVKARRRPSR